MNLETTTDNIDDSPSELESAKQKFINLKIPTIDKVFTIFKLQHELSQIFIAQPISDENR